MRNSTIALISAVISSFTFYFIWKNNQHDLDDTKSVDCEENYDSNSDSDSDTDSVYYNNCCNSPCSVDSTYSDSYGSDSTIRNRNVEDRLDKICDKLEEYLKMENVN